VTARHPQRGIAAVHMMQRFVFKDDAGNIIERGTNRMAIALEVFRELRLVVSVERDGGERRAGSDAI
jgi:hypothetical protein